MSMLLDPVGFICDCISIAHALGFYTTPEEEKLTALCASLKDAKTILHGLVEDTRERTQELKNAITVSTVIEVRSRLANIAIPSDRLELLIKLLYLLKERASNVVFGIVSRYCVGRTVATLGFAGTSSDAIEDQVRKAERFSRAISLVPADKTSYTMVRIRGRYDPDVENFCSAAITAVATEVCGLSRNVEFGDAFECHMDADECKTVVLLQPVTRKSARGQEFDFLRRCMLVGDTRTGKSTIGNALVQSNTFKVSRGMTGTMKISRGERVDIVQGEQWVTEVYDTPGLNDKDGLDIVYETAIEDQITILQRVSTLIMSVSVDAGVTGSMFKSMAIYKELFGTSITSMLLVVLTVNESAELEDLNGYLELNWPTVSSLDDGIDRRNVFCVSLHDLRNEKDSPSHVVVNEMARLCRAMPLKLIETLVDRYRELREALLKKSGDLERRVQRLINDGWQRYDDLTDFYEQSPYVKLTDGLMDGFVIKKTTALRWLVAAGSGGMVNRVRKTAIHVKPNGRRAERVWYQLLEAYDGERHRSDLMRIFGDMLNQCGLAVNVVDETTTHVGSLRVKRYSVSIIDPASQTHEELIAHLHNILSDRGEDLTAEVIDYLFKSVVPPAIRTRRTRIGDKAKQRTALFMKHSLSTAP